MIAWSRGWMTDAGKYRIEMRLCQYDKNCKCTNGALTSLKFMNYLEFMPSEKRFRH